MLFIGCAIKARVNRALIFVKQESARKKGTGKKGDWLHFRFLKMVPVPFFARRGQKGGQAPIHTSNIISWPYLWPGQRNEVLKGALKGN
jgi:hypothetical protein